MNAFTSTPLPPALFLLRIGVFIPMAWWSLDKLVNPNHAATVFENFYGLTGVGVGLLFVIGVAQLIIEIGFLAGLYKFWTYGFVLVTHLISTLSSWRQYLSPFDNLLFLAAIPMLAACTALFLLRGYDQLWTLGPLKPEWRKNEETELPGSP